MAFEATARIPCRPLSYDNSTMAEPKELIIDYENHTLHLCDVNGDIVPITLSLDTLLSQLESLIDEKIKEAIEGDDNSNILKEITINLPDNTTIIAETAIIESLLAVREIKEIIKNGTAIDTIPAEKVIESTVKQFVSEDDKKKWNQNIEDLNDLKERVDGIETDVSNIKQIINTNGGLVDIFTINVAISGVEDSWVSTNGSEPYTQTITVAEIKATDNPVVDVLLSETYDTAMEQLNSYAYIYKITTFDGYIKVFASEPTKVGISVQMKIDRKNS